ncbi:MAG: U32 family peptidase [Alphaproteobacteria bacterium]|nr:U32 family peptidase [Alphaproteobacteria bacterium]
MKKTPRLTLGPLFFHWPADKRRDFYFRIADEAAIDCVYLGEVVCSKREVFFEDMLFPIAERLRKAGKEVVLSTLALVTSDREMKAIKDRVKAGFLIEANDVACLQALAGKPHVIGPFINVFNESARDFLIRGNATRIVLPVEIPAQSIGIIAGKTETEIQVFGRQPLSVAMRCYSARAHGRHKDGCQFVCGRHPDGLTADTVDGQPILTVNGTQTLSHGYAVLLRDLATLQKMGVTHFRLSPQDVDMVEVARIYRAVLDGQAEVEESEKKLRKLTGDIPYVNGFLHGREGLAWVEDRI